MLQFPLEPAAARAANTRVETAARRANIVQGMRVVGSEECESGREAKTARSEGLKERLTAVGPSSSIRAFILQR